MHETTEALEAFLDWATGERGLSRATARAYVRDLRLVADKLEERHATRLPYATMTHLRRALAALRADGVRADALAAVRVWGEFLVATGRVEVSPAAGLDEPSIQAVLPRHLRGPRIDPRLRDFIEWGRRRRRWSEATVPNYHRRVVVFLDWAAANGVRVKRSTPADVRAFLTTLHPSPAVWSSGHSALLAYFDWLSETGGLTRNPARLVERARMRPTIPRSLEHEAAAAVLETARCEGPRMYAFVGLMLYAGLRRAEVCKVRWGDLEQGGLWLRVRGKGDVDRVLPVHPELRDILTAWRAVSESADWVFRGRYGTSISLATGTKWMREILDAAGVPEATGHMLRHTYATQLIENGIDVPTVQAALGHASLSSTNVYVKSRPKRVAEAVGTLNYARAGAGREARL